MADSVQRVRPFATRHDEATLAAKLPYMLSPGLIPKIFAKIQEARRPDRFTQDFLGTKLGHSGGSAMAFIPLVKRMGFVASDGVPTRLYDRFRNAETQGSAMAEGIRAAFAELFERNEYAHELPKEKLTSLVVEITGAAKDDRTVQAIVSTFLALKALADFDAKLGEDGTVEQGRNAPMSAVEQERHLPVAQARPVVDDSVGLNLSYTVNIVLPETTDPEVFAAIFKSLREHMLKST